MRTRWLTGVVAGVASLTLLVTGCGDSRDSVARKPATAAALVASGLEQLGKGDSSAALQAFREAAVKEPNNHLAHYNTGVILQQQGMTAAALTSYGLALAAKPDFVPAMFNSAVIYGPTDPDLAIATYRRIIKLQPIAPTAYLNLGLLEAARGQETAARAHLAKAVEQDGSLVTAIPKDVFSGRVRPASPSPSQG